MSTATVRLETLKSLRKNANFENKEERLEFLLQVGPLVKDWHDDLPDLRHVFLAKEMELLCMDLCTGPFEYMSNPFISFVAKSGYKDEPDLDEDGKPPSRRTTPVHLGFRRRHLMTIYWSLRIFERYDVNYSDESGLTHFIIACTIGDTPPVKNFLEQGHDPNYVCRESGYTPLHVALLTGRSDVIDLLLRRGANPHLCDSKGSTALHIAINNGNDNLFHEDNVDILFRVSDDIQQPLPIDARDNLGRTPLQLAVVNGLSETVDLLLDHGADFSNFVFPTESHFDAFKWRSSHLNLYAYSPATARLRVSGVMAIVGSLEKRGYELDPSDALTIMKMIAKYGLFAKSSDPDELGYGIEELKDIAKTLSAKPKRLKLNNYLWRLPPEEASKVVKSEDYLKLEQYEKLWARIRASKNLVALDAHLCELMTRKFFLKWALEPFIELTHNRLPILCCDMIIENLCNEDLYNICLAAAGQSS